MKKLLITLLFTASINTVLHAKFSRPPQLSSNVIHTGQEFMINSEVEIPLPRTDYFKWHNEDHWKLISYPSNAMRLITTDSLAPDWCGGNLLQRWTLIALKSGTFELTFKRYSECITVIISVR